MCVFVSVASFDQINSLYLPGKSDARALRRPRFCAGRDGKGVLPTSQAHACQDSFNYEVPLVIIYQTAAGLLGAYTSVHARVWVCRQHKRAGPGSRCHPCAHTSTASAGGT